MYAAELYLGAHRIYRRQQGCCSVPALGCQMAIEFSAKLKEDQGRFNRIADLLPWNLFPEAESAVEAA